jgi:hypothetical protein
LNALGNDRRRDKCYVIVRRKACIDVDSDLPVQSLV